MSLADYIVLLVYFGGMAGIGFWAMKSVKKQEDFFMGGRQFGKLFQTFAAFGAGTGSADPVNTARGTFANGMSGMWGVMYWLFVTPIYWISAVWYRRMRCLTLGEWFTERYESKNIGVAYAIFGCFYYVVYGAMLFTAIGKVAVPLMGPEILGIQTEFVLVPLVAIIVVVYGVLGGVTAAYWTDLIQGMCIVALSVMLIPFGLQAVVKKFGADGDTWTDGFRVMHEQLPEHTFTILGGNASSEFPLFAIVVIVIMNMVGIVLTPHFIVTGGGTAKSEHDARVGLVTGNFIKRFCTVGWVITALIVLTLYSGQPELINDPDQAWGVATKQLLGPLGIGLVGLMLACLLAALMSSVDTYMLVCAALVVRNIYVPIVKADATEKECLKLGRITGMMIVAGAVIMAMMVNDMFAILKQTWIVPMTFAALFWVGMYWRRATTTAGWITVIFCLLSFFILPRAIPTLAPGLKTNPEYMAVSQIVETTTVRKASPSDVNSGKAAEVGEEITDVKTTGGQSLYWSGGVKLKSAIALGNLENELKYLQKMAATTNVTTAVAEVEAGIASLKTEVADSTKVLDTKTEGESTVRIKKYEGEMQVAGEFRFDMLIYTKLMGIDLSKANKATLQTLDLPFKIVAPFLVMIIFSLLTKPNSKESLDKLYVKMKTPVDPDPEGDIKAMEESYANPDRFDDRKLFRGTGIEIQRPTKMDFFGFIGCFAVCFAIIALIVLVSKIGT
ncbi:MAG: sodium:solute symporter family protein [Limisphaerales bacterium]